MTIFVVLLVAMFVYFLLAAYLAPVKIITSIKLKPHLGKLASRDDIPPDILVHLDKPAAELFDYGFKLSHVQLREEPDFAELRWIMVLINPIHGSFVELTTPTDPSSVNTCAFRFITFETAVSMMSINLNESILVESTEHVRVNIYEGYEVSTAWSSHLEFVDSVRANAENNEKKVVPSPADYHVVKEGLYRRQLDEHVKNDELQKVDDHYKIDFWSAIKLIPKVKRDLAKINASHQSLQKNNKDDANETDLTALEVIAYNSHKKVMENSQFEPRVKMYLFLLSAIGFSLIIGFLFSWPILIALFPVLLFHELGHFLAMKWFGYKNLQILFVPLGAVAMGREAESWKPWKEAVVLLAGPVPGLLIAFAAIAFWPDRPDWAHTLVITSLILNYFNLFPFMPLDGGQLVRLAAFNGRRNAILVFKILSTLTFLIVATVISDSVLRILGIFMAFDLFNEIKSRIQLAKYERLMFADLALHNTEFKDAQPDDRIKSAFVALKDLKATFSEKVQIVTNLELANVKKPTEYKTASCIVLVYLSLFIVPVVVGYNHVTGDSFAMYDDEYEYEHDYERVMEVSYWNETIDAKTDDQEKLDVMLEAGGYLNYSEQSEDGKLMYTRANELSQKLGLDEYQAHAQLGLIENAVLNDQADEALNVYNAMVTEEASSDEVQSYVDEAVYELSMVNDASVAQRFLQERIEQSEIDGDEYESASAREDLANNYIELNSIDKAKLVMQDLSSMRNTNAELNDTVATALSDLYLQLDDFANTQNELQILLDYAELEEQGFQSGSVMQKVGWVSLMKQDIASAKSSFQQSNAMMAQAQEEFNESLGLLGKLLFSDLAEDSYGEDVDSAEANLVMAYLSNDRVALDSAYATLYDLHGLDANLVDNYTMREDYETKNGFHNRKSQLIIAALEFYNKGQAI